MPNLQSIYNNINDIKKMINQIIKDKQGQKLQSKSQAQQISDKQNKIIDIKSAYIDKFSIADNQVKMIKGGQYFQLLGKVLISQKSINKFTIVKTLNGMIKLAIVDRKYIKQKDSFNKKQCFYYSVKSGIAWESGLRKFQGKPSKQKQEVVMVVQGGSIRWMVNGQIRAQMNHKMLQDPHIQWVPFIAMFDKGDQIIWI